MVNGRECCDSFQHMSFAPSTDRSYLSIRVGNIVGVWVTPRKRHDYATRAARNEDGLWDYVA